MKKSRTYSMKCKDAQDLTIYVEEDQAFPETVEDVQEIVSGGKDGVDYTYGDMTYESTFDFVGDDTVYDESKGIFLPHRAGCTPYAVIVSHKGVVNGAVNIYPDFNTAVYYAEKEINDFGYYLGDFNFYDDDTFADENLEVSIKDADVFPQC